MTLAPERPGRFRAATLVVGVVVLGLLFWLSLEVNFLFTPVNPGGQVSFVVPSGATARDIAQILHEAGLIKSPVLFRLIAKYHGLDGRLKAGDYQLEAGLTMSEIVRRLEEGQVKTIAFTVPEGLTVVQVAELLEQKGLVSKSEFLEAARDLSLVEEFLPAGVQLGEPLEGYLFPETYHVGPDASAPEIVRLMLDTLKSHISADVSGKMAEMGYSLHEVLTLASIIEKEAVIDDERAIISGVYHNRLRINMKLDADPTVLYAHGRTHGSLTYKDLDIESAYNTYRVSGLPPGPIASPGWKSIQAALYPAEVDYFYFVARDDSSHVFSRTLAEHNANVRRYQSSR